MSKTIGWDRRLRVAATGKNQVGQAGAVLLRACADRTGLTAALSQVMPSSTAAGWWDRGVTLASTAVAIVLGAVNLSDCERLWAQQVAVFGAPVSDSTIHRALAATDDELLARISRARAKVRRHVWSLLRLRPGGFPWLVVAGKRLTGWVVIDIDATLITAHSAKQGAAVTFKKTWGHHPLAAWCANTSECLAMLLREGNAGSNTVTDHLAVLAEALRQVPGSPAAKILVRVDGAGATHELLEHLQSLNTMRRTVRYTVGWKITDADERAIAALPERVWAVSLHQDGREQQEYGIAELTGLNTRTGWPEGMRLLVRRTRWSARHVNKLTPFELKTGWRYQITATNIGRMWGIAGSHHPQWLDVLHRAHAGVEDRVRTNKALGLGKLPSKSWEVNCGWVLAANLAADLDAWTRLLGLHDSDDLADAEPGTLRYRLLHLPGRLTRHARTRTLAIAADWPWAKAFTTCWDRLTSLPAPT
ncbi:IS1380 family transposase [Actinomadura sp. B10D3]|uniref:IS1380 family transposase n=1 Tax=Actinomadura sp. B10D3 TaxID=3153557 RepID=UPI00325C7CAC